MSDGFEKIVLRPVSGIKVKESRAYLYDEGWPQAVQIEVDKAADTLYAKTKETAAEVLAYKEEAAFSAQKAAASSDLAERFANAAEDEIVVVE